MFRAIASDKFAPFGVLELQLPAVKEKPNDLAEVHLFTGVNGTGKTRLLSLICAILGNPQHLLKRSKGQEQATFFCTSHFDEFQYKGRWDRLFAHANGVSWQATNTIQPWANAVPAFAYSGNAYVIDSPVTAMGNFQRPDRNTCLSFDRPEGSSGVLLQAITNLLLEAAMDTRNGEHEGRAAKLVNALESTITLITGRKFRFKTDKPPQLALSVVWGDTKLLFDSLPDGLRSILGWIVHAIVMMDIWVQGKGYPLDIEAVFLLDEIESHLHPAWQRKILPAFQRLFPKSQIFVATHSPFVIASLNYGWIHLLTADANNGKAKVEKSFPASKGDSYISVVEEIMGVKEWYDPETENLLTEFRTARDAAYQGDTTAETKARQLAVQIGQRSTELDFMMGKELIQMDRQLSKVAGKQ